MQLYIRVYDYFPVFFFLMEAKLEMYSEQVSKLNRFSSFSTSVEDMSMTFSTHVFNSSYAQKQKKEPKLHHFK